MVISNFFEKPPCWCPQWLPPFTLPPAVDKAPPSPRSSPELVVISSPDDGLCDLQEMGSPSHLHVHFPGG